MLNKIYNKYLKKNNKNNKQYCIDSIEQRESGLFIIGWYLTDLVQEVYVMDKKGVAIPHSVETIVRSDVEALLGTPAKGFQVHCSSEKNSSGVDLHIVNFSGQTTLIDLSNPTQNALIGNVANVISAKSDENVVGSYCEYIVCYERSMIIVGWIIEKQPIQKISVTSKSGELLAEGTDWLRIIRPDVAAAFPSEENIYKPGIIMRLDLEDNRQIALDGEIEVGIEFSNGVSFTNKVEAIDHYENTTNGLAYLLNPWNPEELGHINAAPKLIFPILQEIYNPKEDVKFKRIDFGSAPKYPSTSIIIPLYGRYDFMRYQLSSFSHFGGMEEVEILYVVDDPKIAPQVLELAAELQHVFKQNFSIVALEKNMGFGMANNIGVNQANGENLILLNSDVLPDNDSWHKDLTNYLDSLDNAGIVGVRLLFEDDSIQHDGMAPMILPNYPNLLLNDHPKKGWPLSLAPKSNEPEPCLLVTAACIAIKKSLYNELNGFDPSYILGDFEDSDLCLRASQAGKTNYICRNISMHHLERLSQNLVDSGNWKHKVTMLNAVTYNCRWKTTLEDTFTKIPGTNKNA